MSVNRGANRPRTALPAAAEPTLDPATPAGWAELRALGHRMIDDVFDHLAALRDQPAWRPMPDAVRNGFTAPPPMEGQGAAAAYADFVANVLPYPNGNDGPRFWGWVQGQGTPVGMLADLLASALNPNLAGFNQAPALVEQQVVAWMAELMGMPAGTGGLLHSSGTMANVLAIAVARAAKARDFGWDVRSDGLQSGRPRMTFYGSIETHSWARKAADVLGFGTRAYRPVGVGADYRLDLAQLAAAVAGDRAAGHRPFCVIGTAGTVNTGATDDLNALADFCAREELWFHVDGAFGAFARLSPSLAVICTPPSRLMMYCRRGAGCQSRS